MSANRLYYHLKPYLPWRFRMALRRVVARRKRKVHQDVWPVCEAAGRPPEGWSGWPDGKQFAFVLTHDVEGPAGLAKCRQLMELEMKLGFHSSFNFVPEGEYAVSRELREQLVQNGFEVGVHDLHHDGKLYWTRAAFSENARWINHYLKEWGAAGFRSGFMLHNLDWLHELNVQYDASTFDTDPFEPQPDGVGTIFPFWVPAPQTRGSDVSKQTSGAANGMPPSAASLAARASSPAAGYIELPYTLVQDSTLFLSLCEPTPEIWFRKLDWIVRQGGMALLNVHPDYLQFSGEPASPRTFPVAHYVQLLQYVASYYAGVYWQPLPKEMAQFCSVSRPQRLAVSGHRVGMISYSVYRRDNRVIRYAQALAERGDEVDVISLKREPSQASVEKVGLVQIFPISARYQKNQENKSQYLLPLLKFWLVASTRLAWRHFWHRYDLIHVHNMPDFLVFAAWFPKLTGAKIIFDVHDIMPELYASKFHQPEESSSVRVLKAVERASARFANHVIISNHLWLEPFVARSAPSSKCSVFINYVNRKLFCPGNHVVRGDKRIIMFPGGLQWHQGLDIAIRAMPTVLQQIPSAELHIYGDGNMKKELVTLAQDLGLEKSVRFFDPRPVSEIVKVMAQADLGVVPKRADSFGNEAYSTKIMEFMALGVPVVVSSTKIDRFYFNDLVVRFFVSGNPDALAEAVVDVLHNNELRRRLIANALVFAERNSWDCRKAEYLELVDSLIENRAVRFKHGQPNASASRSYDQDNLSAGMESGTEPAPLVAK